MGTAHPQEDRSLSNPHKVVQFSKKIGIVKVPRPYGPIQRPSYVSEEEVFPDEYPVQLGATIARSPIATTDEGPWARKTILTVDGGGIRGYSSLLILQQLMENIAHFERSADPKATSSAYSPLIECLQDKNLPPMYNDTKSTSHYLPCHYFDYVAGTSTGGLIAIMLGRLRMTIDDCIEEYEHLSARVFQKPSSRLRRSLTNYNKEAKWRVLQDRFDKLPPIWPSPSEGSEKPVLFKSDPYRCRTIVCTIKSTLIKDFQTPYLFRSYDQTRPPNPSMEGLERSPSKPDTLHIWQVARATSAAPSYFKPVRLDDNQYYDAAMDLNNPSWEVVKEVRSLAGGSFDAIDVLLSVGGGNARVNKPKSKFGGGSFEKALADISEVVHHKVSSESKNVFKYYRLDVEEGLQDVRLNEWKPKSGGKTTLRKIREATTRYLQKQEVRSQCQQCAMDLVRKRKQRARTMRWECFATGTRYKCPKENCRYPTLRFPTRNDLMDHLRMRHDYPPPDAAHYQEIETLLDKGKTNTE